MAQHALECFERGAATWWRMYQTINGWQGVTTWKEFKLTLQRSHLVSPKLKPYGNDMKKSCAYKPCGEIGHTIRNTRMNALIVKEVTQLKNAQLGRLLVSCVKGLPTTLLSITFTHGTKNHPAEEISNEMSPQGNFRRACDEGRGGGQTRRKPN